MRAKTELDIEQFDDMIPFANMSAAMEFLLTVKSGIRNYAFALTECMTPAVREVVHAQLLQALDLHEQLSALMVEKGWLLAYHPSAQFELDVQSAERTLRIAKLPLFQDRSKILDAFDTPVKHGQGGGVHQ